MLGLIAMIEMDDRIKGIRLPFMDRILKILAFADDSTLFIGHVNDPLRYVLHLNLFEEASGLGSNWDKTIGMRLGHWSDNPPQEFDNTIFKWVTQDDSIRALGIMVGDKSTPSKSWDKLVSKVRSFVTTNNPGNLTLMGRVNLANASMLGCLVYYLFHQFTSYNQRQQISSLMNQFTNGNKVRSQCTYDDKIKAHTEGGPPVVLLDIHTMADGLSILKC